MGSGSILSSEPSGPRGVKVTLYPVTSLGGPVQVMLILTSETSVNCRSVGAGTTSEATQSSIFKRDLIMCSFRHVNQTCHRLGCISCHLRKQKRQTFAVLEFVNKLREKKKKNIKYCVFSQLKITFKLGPNCVSRLNSHRTGASS